MAQIGTQVKYNKWKYINRHKLEYLHRLNESAYIVINWNIYLRLHLAFQTCLKRSNWHKLNISSEYLHRQSTYIVINWNIYLRLHLAFQTCLKQSNWHKLNISSENTINESLSTDINFRVYLGEYNEWISVYWHKLKHLLEFSWYA